MGGSGYYTTFTSDSGGAIMEVKTDEEVPETKTVTATAKKSANGTNRRRRLGNVVKKVAKKEVIIGGGGHGGGRILISRE